MFISVLFPAPFSPQMTWISPVLDVEVDMLERCLVAEPS